MHLFIDPIALWLVAARLSGWMMLSPGFTEINTPQLTRAFLIVWLSYLLLPLIGPIHAPLGSWPELIVALLGEFVIGAGYGLMLRLIFGAVQFGGVLIDSELGYLYAQQVNPYVPLSGGIFGRLFLLLAVLYFWLFDYFRVVLVALRESFVLVPIGAIGGALFDLGLLVKMSGALFVGGLTMAAPIMALMFFVTISIGFLARTVQGLSLFSENFVFRIIVGLCGLVVLLPLLFLLMRIEMEQILPMSSRYFKFALP
ncbi:MAG TPA: flagellar biosynthetic protein FliR [Candidatus Methylacidiphilales bacterium]